MYKLRASEKFFFLQRLNFQGKEIKNQKLKKQNKNTIFEINIQQNVDWFKLAAY